MTEILPSKSRYYVRKAKDRDGWYVTDRKDGENYAWRGIEKDANDLCTQKNRHPNERKSRT